MEVQGRRLELQQGTIAEERRTEAQARGGDQFVVWVLGLFIPVLTLAMACLFLGAAAQKALALYRFIATLEQLGFSGAAARWGAPSIVLLEASASLLLVFRPASALTFTLVMALSSAFAAAGLFAEFFRRVFGWFWSRKDPNRRRNSSLATIWHERPVARTEQRRRGRYSK